MEIFGLPTSMVCTFRSMPPAILNKLTCASSASLLPPAMAHHLHSSGGKAFEGGSYAAFIDTRTKDADARTGMT